MKMVGGHFQPSKSILQVYVRCPCGAALHPNARKKRFSGFRFSFRVSAGRERCASTSLPLAQQMLLPMPISVAARSVPICREEVVAQSTTVYQGKETG